MQRRTKYIIGLYYTPSTIMPDASILEMSFTSTTIEGAISRAKEIAASFTTTPAPLYWYLEDSLGFYVWGENIGEQHQNSSCKELLSLPHAYRITRCKTASRHKG